ncbi:nucleoside hydrolase [Butyrivibrio fibrisolvens]|uniref:nucleoside hydrolase n=1 Tax=Butyrivibrio fibrisolvens TaxID=831 RepID=UPI001FA85ECD|nr:nucleoside hydrolase [Butyrivibrio fibrisolvens]
MKKIIIDCDPGIDDSLAIMLALQSPEVEVVGITIVAGNAPSKMGFENAKKVLNFLGRLDVPVYVGADKPRVRDYVNALDTHGSDGLGESFLPEVEGQSIPSKSAVDFLKETLRKGNVSVVSMLSACIETFLFGGITSAVFTTFVVQALSQTALKLFGGAFLTQLVTDYVDKLVANFLVAACVKVLPSGFIDYKTRTAE